VIRTDLADWLSFPLVFDPGVGGQKNKDLDREQCGALALLVYHLGGMSPAGKKGLGGVLGVIDSLFDREKLLAGEPVVKTWPLRIEVTAAELAVTKITIRPDQGGGALVWDYPDNAGDPRLLAADAGAQIHFEDNSTAPPKPIGAAQKIWAAVRWHQDKGAVFKDAARSIRVYVDPDTMKIDPNVWPTTESIRNSLRNP
jgi:hypothetical protein